MFNRAFDAWAERVPPVAPPLLVAGHRSGDDPLFVPDEAFDRATHAFGWADGTLAYTGARRFRAPSGLDAVVLYHAAGASRRGADLLVFALGQVVARVRLAEMIAPRPADPPGPDDGTEERIPLGDGFDRISVARIGTDGDLRIRTVTRGPDGHTDETVESAALRDRPAARRLPRARIEDAGRIYEFDDAELAQLEAGVPKHLTVTEHFLPVILSAAESKYRGLPEGAWRLAAESLGLSVEAARAMAQARAAWWAQYARQHDGEPPGREE